MPCWAPNGFGDGGGAVSESAAIAKMFTAPSPACVAALDACGSFFGGVAKFLKNTEAGAAEDAARANLEEQLGKLEAVLGNAGPFLAGATPGLADCSIATKLYILFVAGQHFKGFILGAEYPSIARYWTAISAHPAFYKTRYPEAEMLHGWGQARGG